MRTLSSAPGPAAATPLRCGPAGGGRHEEVGTTAQLGSTTRVGIALAAVTVASLAAVAAVRIVDPPVPDPIELAGVPDAALPDGPVTLREIDRESVTSLTPDRSGATASTDAPTSETAGGSGGTSGETGGTAGGGTGGGTASDGGSVPTTRDPTDLPSSGPDPDSGPATPGVTVPPVTVPPVSLPPATVPPATLPPVTVPPITTPTVPTVPPVTLPVTVPTQPALPTQPTLPSLPWLGSGPTG